MKPFSPPSLPPPVRNRFAAIGAPVAGSTLWNTPCIRSAALCIAIAMHATRPPIEWIRMIALPLSFSAMISLMPIRRIFLSVFLSSKSMPSITSRADFSFDCSQL
ncbi:hypothetical protein DM45_2082 [Burkholderia mallei]|nr:hypothetical protein DM46_824 [Burkholderia mallei]KOS78866.1 hypothetical protein DM53_2753 [Burkholderia mallei]KOS90365.1 hypothetical protein DM45_2082 [Burkholderia mallei]KOT06052.1 hypothetical protein DM77_1354 [Burkholderia mallei]